MLPTWMFERDGAHLTLHCRETRRGVTLIVGGDGDLRSYSFHDFAALMQFEQEMEEFLIETGWTQTFPTIESRAMPDRQTPAGTSRRSPSSVRPS